MSLVIECPPEGTLTWISLGAPDLERAMAFYGALFGWEFRVGSDDTGRCTICLLRGEPVGALAPGADSARESAGERCSWQVHFATSDCDRTADRVRAAGGRLLVEPIDVAEYGRMAVAVDPTGAEFGLWQGHKHIGARRVNEPGATVRNDLVTPDPEQAREFYSAVFGFVVDGNDDLPEYDFTFLRRPDGHEIGGILGQPAAVRSEWNITFEVADADTVATAATARGGQAAVVDAMSYGRFITVTDPFGARFSIIAQRAGR